MGWLVLLWEDGDRRSDNRVATKDALLVNCIDAPPSITPLASPPITGCAMDSRNSATVRGVLDERVGPFAAVLPPLLPLLLPELPLPDRCDGLVMIVRERVRSFSMVVVTGVSVLPK